MKKCFLIILSLITLIVTSCEKSPEEKLIANFIEVGNLDMDFDMKEIEKVRDITAQDSLNILIPEFEQKKKNKIEQLTASFLEDSTKIELLEEQIEDAKNSNLSKEYREKLIADYKESLRQAKERKQHTEKIIEAYKTDGEGTSLEWLYNKIQEYKTNPDKLLATEYKVVFTFTNLFKNSVEQKKTRYFILNADRTKIISYDKYLYD